MSGGGPGTSEQESPRDPGEGTPTAASPRRRMEGVEAEIDEYRLIEAIGEGGMGVIYKAEQRGAIRRVVALKVIKLGLDTKAVIARFEAERQALALMNHPNIARVFGAGSTPLGRPYFVMEFVPGEPITAYCDRHKLSIRHRLELFSKVCEAIQHAHTKGIIHRDLKATNVLVADVDGKAVPKVIDFGVAKATSQRLTEQTLFTEQGLLIGTPAYASPEQAEGGADVDTRSDVYSLGVMLYELLTGALPFDPMKLRDLAYGEMQRVIREVDPPRPSTFYSHPSEASLVAAQRRAATVEELASALRHELEWIPLRAMRKERGERYQTVADFARDIGNYLGGKPLLAAPDSRMYRWRKAVRRNRGLVAALAAVALALLLGTGVATWQALRANQQRELAERNAQRAQKRLAQAEASSQVLNDIFAAIEPNVVQGKNTELLRDVLLAAEPKLNAMMTEPHWRAELLTALGNAFRLMSDDANAGRILKQAVDLARQSYQRAVDAGEFEDDFKEVRTLEDALEGYGRWMLGADDAGPASVSLFREALAIVQEHLPKGDPTVTDAMSNLGIGLRQAAPPAGDPQRAAVMAEAETLQVEAHRRATADPQGHAPLLRATIAANLGAVRYDLNDPEAADEAYQQADTLYREANATRTTEYAALLRNRAALAHARGRLDEALDLLNRALALRRELAVEVDVKHQVAELEWRATVLIALNQASPAADDRLEAIRLLKTLPADSTLQPLATNAEQAGWLLHEAGRLEEAREVLSEGMDFIDRAITLAKGVSVQPDVRGYEVQKLRMRARWAQVTLELGDAQAAMPVIRECLKAQMELDAKDVLAIARNHWILAETLLAGSPDPSQVEEARSLLLDAARGLAEASAPVDRTIGNRPATRERVLRRLLELALKDNDDQQAQEWRRQMHALGISE